MRRCSTCGNYYESNSGFCSICGASNIDPYQKEDVSFTKRKRVKKVKKTGKRISLKKLVFVMLFMGFIILAIFRWNDWFPQYGKSKTVTLGDNQIPSIIAYTGPVKGVFGSKTKGSSRVPSLTLNFPEGALSDRDIERYQSNLKSMRLFSDGYSDNGGFVMCGKARERGNIITIRFQGGRSNQFSIIYSLTPGSLSECTYGETIRTGSIRTGYFNRPMNCRLTVKTSNKMSCQYKDAVVTINGVQDITYHSYEKVIDEQYRKVNQNNIAGIIKDLFQSKAEISNRFENDAVVFTYYDIKNRLYVSDYIIYYKEIGRLQRMTIKSTIKNSQYFNLIYSYSPEANPLK